MLCKLLIMADLAIQLPDTQVVRRFFIVAEHHSDHIALRNPLAILHQGDHLPRGGVGENVFIPNDKNLCIHGIIYALFHCHFGFHAWDAPLIQLIAAIQRRQNDAENQQRLFTLLENTGPERLACRLLFLLRHLIRPQSDSCTRRHASPYSAPGVS